MLVNLVVPRPIAWVTTMNETGLINLAPFSFFNAVGSKPLYLMFSAGPRSNGEPKDTTRNIKARGEFVVNLVTEDLLPAMNISGADFPPNESEVAPAGLSIAASLRIATPRLKESQASMECQLHQTLSLGENTVFIGEVLMFHVADHLLGPNFHIHGFAPIGRMGSPATYCRTVDRFELPRLSHADVMKQR